jgi:uncharacterized protein YcfJ
MAKSALIGATAGAIAVTALGAIASYQFADKEGEFAEVLAVEPVTETIRTPREECRDEAVTRTAPAKDQHQVVGTVAGAVVGGVVGSQFGGGSGKKVATVAGAVAGGYAGNKVQEKMQAGNTYTTTERRCTTVTDTHEKVVGYDVTYRLDDKEAVVRTKQAPGARIPVKDGQLVLEPTPANS